MENKKYCKYCGKEIDYDSNVCSECGKSLINDRENSTVQNTAKKGNNNLPGWAIALIVIVVLGVYILAIGLSYNPNKNTSNNNSTENTDESTKKNNKDLTEKEKIMKELSSLYGEKLAFEPGSYIIGDIPAGEYVFIKTGSSSYYEEDDAAGNIIDNENFDSFGYVKVQASGNLETRGIIVNIDALNRLGVSGAKELYEKLNNQKDWNQAGYYKVGVDIEPGSYILESIGNGYWEIASGPIGSSEIVDNNNFNGRAMVNISNGQYLILSRAKYTKSE